MVDLHRENLHKTNVGSNLLGISFIDRAEHILEIYGAMA